ncbi:MAG: nitroreductase family protein [Desulfobacterales bacterium]|nr:nitroreductase family protein [Desulfobacterales bacterium]
MDYESLMEVIRQRRTTRVYRPDAIPDEFVLKVIEAARWAPTGANTQPFEFVIVKDNGVRTKIKKIFEETTMVVEKVSAKAPVPRVSIRNFLETAPVLILVLGDPRFKQAYPRGKHRDEIFHASLSAAVQNMHLAATALGLGGSVWTTVSFVAAVKIKDLLHIPQIFTLKTIMPLGRPKARPAPPVKREPLVHQEHYDPAGFKSDDQVKEVIEKTTTSKGKLSRFRRL